MDEEAETEVKILDQGGGRKGGEDRQGGLGGQLSALTPPSSPSSLYVE